MNVKIEKLDHFGRGITEIDNKICFVENALPNEIVKINIIKETKKYYVAEVVDFIEKSPNRIIEKCPYYSICGGCDLEHLSFKKENEFKRRKVQELLVKFAKINPTKVKETVFSDEYYYRNKVTFHSKDKQLGYYQKGSNNLIKIDKCYLLNPRINSILKDLNSTENNITEVIIRTSNNQEEIMLKISGEVSNINDLKEKVDVLVYNDEYLTEKKRIITSIGNKKYYLSIDSFFQVNEKLTEKLYGKVKTEVEKVKPKRLLDLYSGTGSFGIYVSEFVDDFVTGVDYSKSNIEDANLNKKLNNITNIEFIENKVENVIEDFKDIDMIIVDPPRSGLDQKTIENIKRLSPSNIVYVSCDPATLARDINLLKEYEVVEVTPFNMFPRTYHVETVCILERRQSTELQDLYDSKFNKLDKTIRRRVDEIPENCYVMMSYALIKNNDKYLLECATARSNNTLAIPGGHILAGEDGITGLKRELKEELNLEKLNIKHLDTIIYPYNNYIFNIYLIEDEIDINNIVYDFSEVVNINWYTKDEIFNKIKEGKVNKGYAYILEKYI